MSVTQLIRPARSVRAHVKANAILAFQRFGPDDGGSALVTADRPPYVGGPTHGSEAVRVSRLIAEAIATGSESVTVLERRARQVAREFRWSRLTDARHGLALLVEGAQAILQLAVTAAEAAGHDLDTRCESNGLSALEDARRAALEMIANQMTENWNALADTIERRFIPALEGWRAVFHMLGGDSTSPTDSNPFGHAA